MTPSSSFLKGRENNYFKTISFIPLFSIHLELWNEKIENGLNLWGYFHAFESNKALRFRTQFWGFGGGGAGVQ